jgi:hypothetical protein
MLNLNALWPFSGVVRWHVTVPLDS